MSICVGRLVCVAGELTHYAVAGSKGKQVQSLYGLHRPRLQRESSTCFDTYLLGRPMLTTHTSALPHEIRRSTKSRTNGAVTQIQTRTQTRPRRNAAAASARSARRRARTERTAARRRAATGTESGTAAATAPATGGTATTKTASATGPASAGAGAIVPVRGAPGGATTDGARHARGAPSSARRRAQRRMSGWRSPSKEWSHSLGRPPPLC